MNISTTMLLLAVVGLSPIEAIAMLQHEVDVRRKSQETAADLGDAEGRAWPRPNDNGQVTDIEEFLNKIVDITAPHMRNVRQELALAFAGVPEPVDVTCATAMGVMVASLITQSPVDRHCLLVALNAALQRIGLAVIPLPPEGRA